MKQYLKLAQQVLKNGKLRKNRTAFDTISLFGAQVRYDLKKGFPLLTTKQVFYKSIIHELIWFISGDTNIKYLVDNDVKIWNEWPYEAYKKSPFFKNESLEEFISKVKLDSAFAKKHGDLGPVYGKQWRDFNGVDQLAKLINEIKSNPYSRRLIISAWNPNQIDQMLLPPCHILFQFYVENNELSCQLYQRSADLFLGVPFNITSYSLLTHMIAQVCNLEVGQFIHTIGDCHIYVNHIEQIKLQLTRKPKKLPRLKINKNIKNIDDFRFEDFEIENYNYHPAIKASVAV